ncbi:AraC family transcriptional regulator [Noviherbaspirillum cavernae]|uniref:AraC family transcriptional regulator n=1 Tax=Noviherbaspirillum cavernae TaxID=2320862 RepID=A0A418WUW6_9BURK|nr:AraC family transcriptional regulator [Noviherbaspirillum cavernae]RJF96495.1 AraC family transcriptional regulator [Noviherbaspirillum cavernae]
MDALSEVFAAVRFSGGVFLDAEFTAPWCVVSQVGPEEFRDQGKMPAHLIAYHYIVAGHLFIRVADAPALEVRAGEIVLLPRNDGHVLGSAPGLRPVVIDDQVQAPTDRAPASLRYGGGGEPTHIVCGYLGCDIPHNPLLSTLPEVLKIGVRDGTGGEWVESSVRHAVEEFAHSGIGSSAVLGKLAELLFVDGVRRYLATLPEGQTGWLAGLRDRMVGRALVLLHTRFAHPWTTEKLAHEVGLSRSAFADRFTSLIGVPPMRYLTNWRLQLAAIRLRESAASTAQLASDVGYESEAAFNRAFKRAFGTTPAAWRKHA